MNIPWRERVRLEPHLYEIAAWAILVPDELPAQYRKKYARNRRIVARILAGEAVRTVAADHDVSPGRVSQLMARCLGGDALSPPALAKGLLPFVNVKPTTRRLPLPTVMNASGAPGAFQQLLCQVPGLASSLDQMLVAKLRDKSTAQTLSPHRFHGEFKRFLSAMNWPKNTYPYTTNHCGYESVRQYFHQRLAHWKTTMAMQRKRDFPQKRLAPHRYAGRMIQIDEQTLDLHLSLCLDINGLAFPIPLPRISVLLAIDVDTHCVLNYALALTAHPNEEDLLELLQRCITPRPLPSLSSPELTYTPGANFPCNLEEGTGFQFGTLQLDNAWMHRSRAVIDWVCHRMGAMVHFGLPRQPKVRALVEHIFHHINQNVSHRPASTTGSHPRDPIKATAREYKKLPLVTFQTLDEMLAVTLSHFNVTPQPSLGGMTPLNCMSEHLRRQCCFTLPEDVRINLSVNINQANVLVQRAKNQSIPYVNFCYAKYYGGCLHSSKIENNQITIRYDRQDIRHLLAYLPNGEFLGELQVSKSWQRFPHSLKLRTKIHRDVRMKKFHDQDKLAGYFKYLLENPQHAINKLDAARVHQAFTNGTFSPIRLTELTHTPPITRQLSTPTVTPSVEAVPRNETKFEWTRHAASHHTREESQNEN